MHQINDIFTDNRNHQWCIHCSRYLLDLETNRDHVPSRGLLQKPYPTNLPIVRICKDCNAKFAIDEQYFVAFLGSVLSGSADPNRQNNRRSADILRKNNKLQRRIENSKTVYKTQCGETTYAWTAEQDRINKIILKNARGHVFYEIGEPMLSEPKYIRTGFLGAGLTEDDINFRCVDIDSFWPEVGSRMMTRIIAGNQDIYDGWIVVQKGTYRYRVEYKNCTLVRTVICEYLVTEVCWYE